MNTITLLGLGAMGSRIGLNLLTKGCTLNVYNRDSLACEALVEKGATAFTTPANAVENADVVIAMVRDDEASKNIWLDENHGAINTLKSNAIALEFSTLSIDWCSQLNQKLRHKGISFLDAPVVGSRPQAEQRQLIHLVGGDSQILKKVKDILSVNANTIHHVGSVTKGMKMKLAVNGLFGIQVAALAEVIAILESSDITREKAVNILNELPTTSPALKGIGMMITAKNYQPLFPISLVAKDFGYLKTLSNKPLINAAYLSYQKANKIGLNNENIHAVIKLHNGK